MQTERGMRELRHPKANPQFCGTVLVRAKCPGGCMTPAFASCSVKCVFYFRPRPRLWTVVILCLAVGIAPITLRAQTFTDMHDFNCNPDGCNGSYPAIPAQGRDGNMYGTLLGGASGNGTVYKITPSGTF